MRIRTRLLLLLSLLVVAACADEPALPAARPLAASAEQLAEIPGLGNGAFAVLKSARVSWTIADQALSIRVVRPQGDGPFPLVVFSHGFGSDIDKYDALLEHWASHGYLILAPYHLDGGGTPRAIFNSLRKGNDGLIETRVADVKLVLDHLPALDAIQSGLAARVDTTRIAIAGHSFGAFTAQQMGGAETVDPDSGRRIGGRDSRVRAVVAISPPGPMFGLINNQSWLALDTPTLVTTGTWDVNARFWPDWRQHALSHDTAKPGRNWLLVVEGADHYLGNLICRPDRKAAPQTDALHMVNATSVTFLDAFVKDDAAARAYLDARPLAQITGGFATLSQR